jgi:hypothetical protein
MGQIAPVFKSLEDAIDAGLRELGLLMKLLHRYALFLGLQQLENRQCLGKNRYLVEASQIRFKQFRLSLA